MSLPSRLGFIWRRAWRIYPARQVVLPAVAAYTIAVVGHAHWLMPRPDQASLAGIEAITDTISLTSLRDNVALLQTNLNPQTWSLQVEIAMALLLGGVSRRWVEICPACASAGG